MPNIATAAVVVGNKFVLEYYTTLSQRPEEIANFYKQESTLTSGIGSFEISSSNEDVETVFGVDHIDKKIKATNFKGAIVVVSGINCQESQQGGVLVSVLGTIQTKRENGDMDPARAFQQVFFLGVQKPDFSYFVLNDIFLFVNTSVSPSPKQQTVVHSQTPFSVTSVPKESYQSVQHHNTQSPIPAPQIPIPVPQIPIPAPQVTHAPVSVSTGADHKVSVSAPVQSHPQPHSQPIPQPNPLPEPQAHPQSQPQPQSVQQPPQQAQQHQQQGASEPAPSSSRPEAQLVSTTSSQDRQHKSSKEPKKPRNDSYNRSNNSSSEWTSVGKKGPKEGPKEGKSPRAKKERDGAEGERKPKNNGGNQRQYGGRKNDNREKKAENQENASEQTSNGIPTSPKNNSWATVVAVVDSDKPVFAPPPIVYTEPPKTEKEPEKEKKKEIDFKPKKIREAKKENPEELAMKRTRELRSVRVGNLPYDIEDTAVIALFKQFGDVKEVVLKKGFAYVEFYTVTGVTNSLNYLRKNPLEIVDPRNNKPRSLTLEQRKPKVDAEPEKPFYKEEKKKEAPTS